MYQEREVNAHAFSVPRSWVRWMMIISMISGGKHVRILPRRQLTLVSLPRQTVIMRAKRLFPTVSQLRG